MPTSKISLEAIAEILQQHMADENKLAILILGDELTRIGDRNSKPLEVIRASVNGGNEVAIDSSWGHEKLREALTEKNSRLQFFINDGAGIVPSNKPKAGDDDYMNKRRHDELITRLDIARHDHCGTEKGNFEFDGERLFYPIAQKNANYLARKHTCNRLVYRMNTPGKEPEWVRVSYPNGHAVKRIEQRRKAECIGRYIAGLCSRYGCDEKALLARSVILHIGGENSRYALEAMKYVQKLKTSGQRVGYNLQITPGKKFEYADGSFTTADEACDWLLGLVSRQH